MVNQNLLIKEWRNAVKEERLTIESEYLAKPNASKLLKKLTKCTDATLKKIWDTFHVNPEISLIAVGGYGRQALFPYSDIDLLILTNEEVSEKTRQTLESVIGTLWDIGFNVGHSVRTLQECITAAQEDITILTNLLEARLITGNKAHFKTLVTQIQSTVNPRCFFDAKLKEQQQRHSKFNGSAYNLEPNLKENLGGLRDLHMILWVASSQKLGGSWAELVKIGCLSQVEYRQLLKHERYLHNLRIRLHYLAKRHEDRLVFDFQNELAASLGYVNNNKKRASEQLMTRYYQGVRFIMVMNELLLKTFDAKIAGPKQAIKVIDSYFSIERDLLISSQPNLLEKNPHLIFQSFLTIQQHPEIKGFSANLINELLHAKKLINRAFRNNDKNKSLFLKILAEPNGVNRTMRSMNRYGILGQYIPAFGKIIGQMQHDLFHVYTVDEHILNVLQNLRRFSKPDLAHEFPLCSKLFTTFDKPYLLYLSALFHDIAKGRGGDHSELGTIDARNFCKLHNLPKVDKNLVSWLVESHLKMSSTAQKTDLSDPEVINQFANFVKTENRLTALYLLTVADIRGTSPNVWNAWKARLLESLYYQTLNVIRTTETNLTTQVSQRKSEAEKKLKSYNIKATSVEHLWENFGEHYFIRFDGNEIAWQTRLLMPHLNTSKPIVRTRLSPDGDGIQVLIYVKDRNDVFARICQFFDQMQYNIAQAKIYTTNHGYALDNFVILEQSSSKDNYSGLLRYLEEQLTENLLANQSLIAATRGRINRQVKHMPIQTKVEIALEANSLFHQLEITANDRPGLLATIAKKILALDIELHNAKINTLGNRVEDCFIISAKQQKMLSKEKIEQLKASLVKL
jgi:[protein-PII] uridylyltransferase